jgi:hypothetical protein
VEETLEAGDALTPAEYPCFSENGAPAQMIQLQESYGAIRPPHFPPVRDDFRLTIMRSHAVHLRNDDFLRLNSTA